MKTIFIIGGTGYIGRALTKCLVARGHRVIAFIRPGSGKKVPEGAEPVNGNPFDAADLASSMPQGSTIVQLLGVAHPGPSKAEAFTRIDLASVRATAQAAVQAHAGHLVYVSVAQEPTRIMAAYQQARAEGERSIAATGIRYSTLRPWYITGPGHRWPILLKPLYLVFRMFPATRQKAKALRLVSRNQMLNALIYAIEAPEKDNRIFEIDEILKIKT